MNQVDAQLLQAARAGDRAALERLLQLIQPSIYRFGMKMCGDPEAARDVLQETLLAAARTIKDFRGEASLSTWLYTIARSFCIKMRRVRKEAPAQDSLRDLQGTEALAVANPARAPDETLQARELQAALDRSLAALPAMYREVLVLRDIEGLTAPEAAQVLGLSVDALKSRLHRARGMVREQLAPVLHPGGEEAARPGCPDIAELFSRHLEGEISADLCAEMERHLASCGRCRTTCDSLREVLSVCRASPEPRVPVEVQRSVRDAVARLAKED